MKNKLIAIVTSLCLLVMGGAAMYGLLGNGTLATSIDSASTQSNIVVDTPAAPAPEAQEPAPMAEEPKAEEPAPAVEEPKAEEPASVVEEPKAEEPAPVVEEPKAEEPAPVVEEPKAEEPAPVVEEPKAEEPAPVVEEPKAEEPAPVVEEPKAEEPAPVVEEPKAEEPAETPVEDQPVVEEPAETPEVDQPVVEEPAETPEADQPVVEEPAETPEADQPVVEEPTETPEADQPVVEEPAETPEENIIPVEPLNAYISASTDFVDVGNAFSVSVSANGGVQPYQATATVLLDGVVMKSVSSEMAENASLVLDYLPLQGGTYTVIADVTDGAGNSSSVNVRVGVRDRSLDNKKDGQWEKLARAVELTGDWRMDVLLVAQSQLGNAESTVDFIMDTEGQNGYTMYGEWAGNAYADWCAAFIGWCFEQAETGLPMRMAAVSEWVSSMQGRNAFRAVGEYTPEAGDIVFIIPNEETEIGHIGLVEYVTADVIGTIEANVGNMVDRRTYELTSEKIGGFGSMIALMESANVSHAEQVILPYEVEDVTDFYAYLNTDKTVNLRNGPSTKTMRKATLSGVGTPVLVTAQVENNGDLWYLIQCEDAYGEQTGYMMAKFLDGSAPKAEEEAEELELTVEEDEVPEATEEPVVEEIPEATEEPVVEEIPEATEEPVVEEAPEATEEPVVEEIPEATEEPVVEEIPEATEEPVVEESPEAIEEPVVEESPEAIEEPVVEEEPAVEIVLSETPEFLNDVEEDLPVEITEWAEEVIATEEMIDRALKAPSLDSLVIEGDALIHVRTGKKIGTYNAATGELIDDSTNTVVAIVDMENGMVYPVNNGSADNE